MMILNWFILSSLISLDWLFFIWFLICLDCFSVCLELFYWVLIVLCFLNYSLIYSFIVSFVCFDSVCIFVLNYLLRLFGFWFDWTLFWFLKWLIWFLFLFDLFILFFSLFILFVLILFVLIECILILSLIANRFAILIADWVCSFGFEKNCFFVFDFGFSFLFWVLKLESDFNFSLWEEKAKMVIEWKQKRDWQWLWAS